MEPLSTEEFDELVETGKLPCDSGCILYSLCMVRLIPQCLEVLEAEGW